MNALFLCFSTVRDARQRAVSDGCNKIATRIVRACKNIFFIQFQEVRLLRTWFSLERRDRQTPSERNRQVKRATNGRTDK